MYQLDERRTIFIFVYLDNMNAGKLFDIYIYIIFSLFKNSSSLQLYLLSNADDWEGWAAVLRLLWLRPVDLPRSHQHRDYLRHHSHQPRLEHFRQQTDLYHSSYMYVCTYTYIRHQAKIYTFLDIMFRGEKLSSFFLILQ